MPPRGGSVAAAEDVGAERAVVKKLARKLEIDELGLYVKRVLGREASVDDLTPEQATKVANAMRAKAARLGIPLDGAPPKGGATEKQLKFIESLIARGKISP